MDTIRRISDGDEHALGALYDRFGTLAYSLAVAILRDTSEAEEAVSDAFSQVWRTAHTFNAAHGSVHAWIVTMVRSRALDRLRSRRRADRYIAHTDDAERSLTTAADPGGGPEQAAEAGERRVLIAQAMDALSVPQRTVLELAYFEGLSQSEIAERLREPLGTVKTRMRTALGRLRGLLAPLRDLEAV